MSMLQLFKTAITVKNKMLKLNYYIEQNLAANEYKNKKYGIYFS